jgi:cytochrome c oxidase accessory protein FixG
VANVRLPLLDVQASSSLGTDGRRRTVHPADVHGRFDRWRKVAFALLIASWAALPWIPIAGHPAVFLDVEARAFYLFGASFGAEDVWLVFFLATGVGFGLVYLTALAGRAWCGWACPQTVFLEGVYRKIERLVEGPREKRMRRNGGPWTVDKLARKGASHALYVLASLAIAHIVLSYFVSLPRAFEMVRHAPAAHPEAFAWVMVITALLYGNFAWFREQLCVVICPYGRLQSVLLDDDSLVVGYDAARGEPRGKASAKAKGEAGDCVDCKRCVVVCPTGIDIRNGLQMDCLACTACIDACDDVMDKLDRPRGLIRYDSQNGLAGKKRRVMRPRVVLYTALLVVGMGAAALAARKHTSYEATLLRLPGEPYVLDGDAIRNAFDLHLVNKQGAPERFRLSVDAGPDAASIVPIGTITIAGHGSAHLPFFVTMPRDRFRGDFPLRVTVSREGGETTVKTGTFLGVAR